MSFHTSTDEARILFHEGLQALGQLEANGIRVNAPYLKRTRKKVERKIADIEEQLMSDEVFRIWKKEFGSRTNLGSREQLGKVLFDVMKFPSKSQTQSKKRHKVDETALEGVDLPFVREYIRMGKLRKVLSTYINGILSETVDGFLHPSYSLHFVVSFRSSCELINFQNLPVRDEELRELVRKAFIARDGHVLVEIDYSGIEVRIAACYHKDRRMLEYIRDPSKDMHRDMAAQCYMLEPERVNKNARYAAKNMFVFPQFYGDYYINCARNMWEACERLQLMVDDIPMRQWLASRGIRKLGKLDPDKEPQSGSFEKHIKEVEKDFWGRRFKQYDQWKKSWYDQYRREGGFDLLTGFRINGLFSRKEVINYPVQGAAFHCLLWSLTRLTKWLNKKKMKSMIVGQIHDSIVADVHVSELDEFLAKAKQVMTVDLPREWDWICVPLEVEAEVAPEGGTWNDKKPVEV